MHVGEALLAHARAYGRRTIGVIGTAKNVGKTVAVGALVDALAREGTAFGVASIGRDGEAVDAVEGTAKPRIFLPPGATFATAAALLPPRPAVEIVARLEARTALGPLIVARVRAAGAFEIAGPPSAAALREVLERLRAAGARTVVVDGAVDRIAALRPDDAVVVATGAAARSTPERVVAETALLVASLRLPPVDETRPAIVLPGALTASVAAALARAAERRQIVVHDATRIAADARAFAAPGSGLDVRCERVLHPVACTVASLGAGRAFEPGALLRALAAAVSLPCYDVYAGAAA